MTAIVMVLARVLLAALFVVSAWRQYVQRERVRTQMAALHIPSPALVLPAAIAVEALAGAALVAGPAIRTAAMVLILFTLVCTWYYYRDLSDRDSFQHFLKNLAIVGGLLLVAAHD